MKLMIYVACGGALGAVCRVGLSKLIHVHLTGFPWGTLAVNLLGCLLIGIAWSAFNHFHGYTLLSALIIGGFLGSFTTFSTFGLDAIHLFKQGPIYPPLLYIGLSNLFGLLLVGVSMLLTNHLLHLLKA